jgi:glycosyltransferase involved in cell wall biosynthesis
MKLFDCTFLNSAGGIKILEIILDNMSNKTIRDYFFLIDSRNDIKALGKLKNAKYKLILNSEFKRRTYYKSVEYQIEKCICLSNVPPPIKLKCEVIIFFHNDLILKPRLSLTVLKSISFFFKKIYIKFINSNKYKWVVQTELMKRELSKGLNIKVSNIFSFPIFKDFNFKKTLDKKSNSFLYVCSSSPHKNINRLIQAFNQIKNINSKTIYLDLTIDDETFFKENILSKNINKNLVIKNHGNSNESSLKKLYSQSKFLIYPSVVESFGLPLIESLEFNCKIIASNLPYVNEIVKPSVVFNPFLISSISDSIDYVIEKNNITGSEMLIKNKIDKFIELIES